MELSSSSFGREELMDHIFENISAFYDAKEKALSETVVRQIEHFVYLQTIDRRWKDHLQAMDHLREGIHFRGYAQKDPKQEYKKEGFYIFSTMMSNIRDEVLEKVFKVEIKQESTDKARQEMEVLQAKQHELAQKLQSRQVLGRGKAEASKGSPAQATQGSSEPLDEEGKLNRHQRRAMKKHSKEKTGVKRG